MNIKNLHSRLKQQVHKCLNGSASGHKDLEPLLQVINETYWREEKELARLEQSLDVSTQKLTSKDSEFQAIFKAFPDTFFRLKTDGTILDYKAAHNPEKYFFPSDLIGKHIHDVNGRMVGKKFKEAIDQLTRTKDQVKVEYTQPHNGTIFHYEARFQPLMDDQIILIIRSITSRKQLENQLRYDALHDKLTDLPNRALFMDRLDTLIHRAKRQKGYHFAVFFIDIDRFKLINDSLGHLAGDELLIQISKRIRTCLRGIDTVARLGGDEFTILLDNIQDVNEALHLAERIRIKLHNAFSLREQNIFITASIGITLFTKDITHPEELLRNADTAMYKAKFNGKDRYEIFDRDMHVHSLKQLHMEASLRQALERDEFEVYYQPIISLKEKKIVRYECLIRWNHPERGLVMPIDFIPIAEDSGFILEIGEWMLWSVCRQSKYWQDKGYPPMPLAVNFSAKQFQNKDLPKLIERITHNIGVSPSILEIEITETTVMNDVTYTAVLLNKLKDMGITISIDDFGIGYSSLSCLKSFPIHSLKIDQHFIKGIPNNTNNTAITTAILAMAKSLNLKIVAEGVNTKGQLEFLNNNNCDEIQGFFFSKPMPIKEATERLSQNNLIIEI